MSWLKKMAAISSDGAVLGLGAGQGEYPIRCEAFWQFTPLRPKTFYLIPRFMGVTKNVSFSCSCRNHAKSMRPLSNTVIRVHFNPRNFRKAHLTGWQLFGHHIVTLLQAEMHKIWASDRSKLQT